MLHNWKVHPGTYRPDPNIIVDFDLWTISSEVFPAIEYSIAERDDRVRIGIGNLSMGNHPMHLCSQTYLMTGSDGGLWPRNLWRSETTEIVGVGQTRDVEIHAIPGDWAFHCHLSRRIMNAMDHDVPNPLGVNQSIVAMNIMSKIPGFMAMASTAWASIRNIPCRCGDQKTPCR